MWFVSVGEMCHCDLMRRTKKSACDRLGSQLSCNWCNNEISSQQLLHNQHVRVWHKMCWTDDEWWQTQSTQNSTEYARKQMGSNNCYSYFRVFGTGIIQVRTKLSLNIATEIFRRFYSFSLPSSSVFLIRVGVVSLGFALQRWRLPFGRSPHQVHIQCCRWGQISWHKFWLLLGVLVPLGIFAKLIGYVWYVVRLFSWLAFNKKARLMPHSIVNQFSSFNFILFLFYLFFNCKWKEKREKKISFC